MKTETMGLIGVGAGTWLAGQITDAKAFTAKARILNDQIDADLLALHNTGRLPNTPPMLPTSGYQPRSKVTLFVGCMVIGFLIVWAFTAALFTYAHFATTGPKDPLIVGFVFGIPIGIGVGWFPGIILFAINGFRENARRSAGVALNRFRDYWKARQEGAAALTRGHHPQQLASYLRTFYIDLAQDEPA